MPPSVSLWECHLGTGLKVRPPCGHNARTRKAKRAGVDPTAAHIQDVVCVDCHRLLPTRDQNSRRVGRAQVSIVPDARIRVRLARQVPRPIMIPGSQPLCLIMVIMCTPPWKICTQSHCSQTRSRHQRRSSRRDRDPGELALPPRCTHRLMEANFVSAEAHPKSSDPWRDPPKPYTRLRCGRALGYHQPPTASRSRRSTWKPQVSKF